MRLPCALARCRPALTRSAILDPSISAIAAKMCIWSFPAGVVASMPSLSDTNAMTSAWSSPSSHQVLQVPAESIEPPAHHDIEASSGVR
jgi:hypothetical protein